MSALRIWLDANRRSTNLEVDKSRHVDLEGVGRISDDMKIERYGDLERTILFQTSQDVPYTR
jgi:hypothetical protein